MNSQITQKAIVGSIMILILFGFYQISKINYKKHREIKFNLVEHPENLPTKEMAKISAFGFKNLRADLYWIDTIQYIG